MCSLALLLLLVLSSPLLSLTLTHARTHTHIMYVHQQLSRLLISFFLFFFQQVEQSSASLFGERTKCPHGKCGSSRYHTPREWFYRTGVNPKVMSQQRTSEAQYDDMRNKDHLSRYESRVICATCMSNENIDASDPQYLQSGYNISTNLIQSVGQMKNIMRVSFCFHVLALRCI